MLSYVDEESHIVLSPLQGPVDDSRKRSASDLEQYEEERRKKSVNAESPGITSHPESPPYNPTTPSTHNFSYNYDTPTTKDKGNTSPKDQTNVSKLTQGMFIVQMNSMHNPTATTFLIDSGASISGVARHESLQNATTCKTPITPAFGEVLCATAEGHIRDDIIGPMVIKALHIPAMHQNLLSVHQLCAGGASGQQQVGIFTSEGCKFFNRDNNRDVLQTLSTRRDTIHGLAKQGVYMYSSVNSGSHHN